MQIIEHSYDLDMDLNCKQLNASFKIKQDSYCFY